jgi:hypothetical protein
MSSQDLDITTTEEEEVHTKRTDPPPAGDIQDHPQKAKHKRTFEIQSRSHKLSYIYVE